MDTFTIIRIAGHSSIVGVSLVIHSTAESIDRAFERLNLKQSGNFSIIELKRQLPAIVAYIGTALALKLLKGL